MRLLDLFCGAGGAAEGYRRAGFTEIVGVDNEWQPRYPFHIVKADALDFLRVLIRSGRIGWYDAVHASPPCQAYMASRLGTGNYPRLIEPTRELLHATELPYVIENVEGAPLIAPITLCGTMFPSLRVLRHRLFESNVPMTEPGDCIRPHPLVYTFDARKEHYGELDEMTAYVQVTGGGNCTVRAARDAMGIPWMIKRELNEAIPPAYTEHVGKYLLKGARNT